MTENVQQRLDDWWASLSAERRAELLPLEEGDELPGAYIVGLTHALGVGPVGVTWEPHNIVRTLVDARIGDFLADRRRKGKSASEPH